MSTPFVVFEQVAKKYKWHQALFDVSFDLREGEIYGFIGPNGAGKTTTLKIMVGLLKQFEGRVVIGGHEMPGAGEHVHRLVGYLPQKVAFQSWRTVDHALMALGRLSDVPDETLKQRIPALLERFDLSEWRHRKISTLSGGMMQKVGFCQALLHQPRLLVLDEPLGGLDPGSRLLLKRIIRELADEGCTIIFSSHILSDVQDVADRMGIIRKGRMEVAGTLDELKTHFGAPRDLELEFSVLPVETDLEGMMEHPGIRRAERQSTVRWVLALTEEADSDAVTHELMSRALGQGAKIRKIGPLAASLDHLYARYIEQQIREEAQS